MTGRAGPMPTVRGREEEREKEKGGAKEGEVKFDLGGGGGRAEVVTQVRQGE